MKIPGKPRIALLTPRFGIIDRGAEVFTYEFAKNIRDYFEVTIYARKKTRRDTTVSSFRNTTEGFTVYKVPCITAENKLINFIYKFAPHLFDRFFINPQGIEMLTFSLIVLPRLLLRNYDIVFPHNGVWGALVARIVRVIRNTPFVYISHGGIEPMIARHQPNAYFVLNKSIEQWYRRFFPQLKVIYVPNPVDTTRFTLQGEKMKLDLESPIIITVAALIPVKRIDCAIRAVARLKKGSLLVVGHGVLKNELLGLGNKLLGKERFKIVEVGSSEMPFYYRTADVFTLAAREEPGSLAPLEAMACGLPIVVNDEDHQRFITGNGKAGIIVDTEDIDAYSKVLKRALNTHFGNLPRHQALKFSWDRMIKIYKKELLSLTR
ncbi:glycosyltransferase [Candidatus Microgenomates bacterium]|nr:glycosyltransferase [Candidatus Microgenomates bacterium]